MSEHPYIPFYTSDFLGGTSGMTASSKGVYITILCLIYEAEGPVTQKWDILARRCGCTLPAFKRAISDLEDDGKIEVSEGEIWSPKCEKHLAQRRDRQNSARSAAKTRWEKDKQKQCLHDADALRSQCQPEPEPEVKEEPKGSSQKRAERAPDPDGFDEFWQAYPHRNGVKRGRAKSVQKFRAAIRSGQSPAALIDAAHRYRADRQVIDGYAKDPATWLGNRCWEDEIETADNVAVMRRRKDWPEVDEIRVFNGVTKRYAGYGVGWIVCHD